MERNYDENKILELHPDLKGEMINGSYIYREGESLYQFYLTKYAGVDHESGEAQYWAKDTDGAEYKTSDWSAAYNTNRQASGDLLPTIYGGIGTTLDFTVSIFYPVCLSVRWKDI